MTNLNGQIPDPIQFAGGPWDGDEFLGRKIPKELRRKGWDGFYRLLKDFYQYYRTEDCPVCEGGFNTFQVGEQRCPGLGGSYEPVEREERCTECGGSGRVEIPGE